ncbi:MAG: hypothetical protein ACLP8S_00755 [Solirubrobacteraceae bacterium]
MTAGAPGTESVVFGHSIIDRYASPTAARVAGVAVAVMLAAFAPSQALAHQLTFSNFFTPFAVYAPSALVGYVVARHRPGNPIGWLLLLGIGAGILGSEAQYYAWAVYGVGDRRLPLGWLAVIVGQADALKVLFAFPLVILVFPDGRASSRNWRQGLVVFTAAGVVALTCSLAFAAVALIDHRVDAHTLNGGGGGSLLINQPAGLAWLKVAPGAFEAAALILVVVSVVHQALSFRSSSGERRQQLKWLMGGGVVCLIAIAALGSGTADGGASLAAQIWSQIPWIAFSALPISIGIAVLKHRLYEIDRLISRTLSYAVLTALLAGTFVCLVALTTQLLPFSSPVGVAASTLAAAVLFNPLRGRVQRVVDRRFNRARYDAEETVAAFAARLRDAVDLDTVQNELLRVVQQAVEPTHATIWIRQQAGRPTAARSLR